MPPQNRQIEMVPLADLIPYARNSRTHSDEQVAEIAASIREFGWTNPVLIDEHRGIIAGHGRVLAARKIGAEQVPCIVLAGLTENQRRAYIIADNKLALNSGWNEEMLGLELADLKADGFDLSLTGFSGFELGAIFDAKAAPEEDEEDVPAPGAAAVTKLGDIWQLGNHRLLCGDSTVPTDVNALLNGAVPHLMVTDPPYGVEYDASWRGEAKNADGTPLSTGENRATGKVENDGRADWREAWGLFPGDVAYVWHAGKFTATVAESLIACGFALRSQIIWAKNNFAIGRGDYHWQHEPCWYAVKANATGHYVGDRKQTTLWSIDKPQKSDTGHSTQKPIECMRKPIENNSHPGDAVYEPFCGSGTTIIAAEQSGRHCYAIELNPIYVDVAVKRWEKFTGKQAILQQSGATFAEVSADPARAING